MHGAPLALVNESFAKRYYPNGEVLGRSLKIPTLKDEPPFTLAAPGSDGPIQIVGVVADALDDGLDKPVKPAIFLPYSLYMWMHTQILVESRGEPQAILHSVRSKLFPLTPISRRTAGWMIWKPGLSVSRRWPEGG